MIRRGLLIAALGAACGPVHASEAVGAPQLNVPISVRQLGMGYTAPGGRDVLRMWSDPSILADLPVRFEAAMFGAQGFGGGSQGALGAGYRLTPAWAVGLMLNRHAVSFPEVDALGDPVGADLESGMTSAAVAGGWARTWLRVGLSLKVVSEAVATDGATGGAADLGVRAAFGDFTVGAGVRNLGAPLREAAGAEPDEIPEVAMPREIRIGAGWDREEFGVRAAAEMVMALGRDAGVGLGAEWWPVPAAGIRAGVNLVTEATAITAGFSALWKGMGLDYALVIQTADIRNFVALSYRFGERGAPAAVPDRPEPREEAKPKPEPEPEPEPEPVAKTGGAKQLNFAVADLRAENVSAGDSAVMADILRSELVRTEAFNVVEKQNMEKVLSEHAFQQTGCSSEECAVKLGKLLNVQRMAVGSFGKLLDSYFLNIRVVDIETGKVVYGDSAEGKTVSDLKDGVQKLARRLAAKVR